MTRVHVEGLVKRYDRVAVVDNASLELPDGQITVVVGPSGAGKTTLARLIGGLEPRDEGEVFFDARLVHELPPQERQVGFVFQDDALWPRFTAAGNVDYALAVRKVPRAERRERVSEALNALRIDTLAAKHPGELSGLQRQRVALARALAVRPSLLVLDEPLGRLETRVRDEFRDDILRVQAETGLTTLVLTNDPRGALTLAQPGQLAVMDLGRIVQAGTPAEVYTRPVDAFVARLLGPTNLVQGQVEGAGARGEAIVRTPLGRLIGRVSADPPAGTPVTLSIRPESLALVPQVPLGWNRFPATVQRLAFLGPVVEVQLHGPGEWPVSALTLQGQVGPLQPGQGVTVSVAPEQVVVLPGNFAGPR